MNKLTFLLIFINLIIDRFEKLDITPKSAQKIKPVLEQWMKEAKGRLVKDSKSTKIIFCYQIP